jgi:hypothetical protein
MYYLCFIIIAAQAQSQNSFNTQNNFNNFNNNNNNGGRNLNIDNSQRASTADQFY